MIFVHHQHTPPHFIYRRQERETTERFLQGGDISAGSEAGKATNFTIFTACEIVLWVYHSQLHIYI